MPKILHSFDTVDTNILPIMLKKIDFEILSQWIFDSSIQHQMV